MRPTKTVAIGPYLFHAVSGNYLGECFLQNGLNFEKHIVDALRTRLRPGDTFLDIGASYGYYTIVANLLTEKNVRVISVEPNPGNLEMLSRNILENDIPNALILSVGAGERWETLSYAGGYLNPIGKTKRTPGLPILVAPLAELLHGIKPDVIKIDIEGFEPPALRGLGAVVNDARVLITEFCPEALEECGNSADDYWSLLCSLGFTRRLNLNTGQEQSTRPTVPICDLLFERPTS